MSLDLFTAKAMGICPICESYGGSAEGEDHPCQQEGSPCTGSCPSCWCPGCHDGHDFPESRIAELDDGDPCGSWAAYRAIEAEKEQKRKRRREARSPQMVTGGVMVDGATPLSFDYPAAVLSGKTLTVGKKRSVEL